MWVLVWWKTFVESESLFIIKEKAKARERRWDGVGVMKDKKLKLEDVEDPHTLGGAWYILFEYIDPAEVGKTKTEGTTLLTYTGWGIFIL